MTALSLHLGRVAKYPQPHHLAEAYLVEAMTAEGTEGLRRYIHLLRGAGVNLPENLEVVDDGRGAVRHDWVSGVPLGRLAADLDAFLAAVGRINAWVTRLDDTDARLDTNMANFLLRVDGRVVTVDVLPPLLTRLRPSPRNSWETLFNALCFDTAVISCALAGYAGRALLAAGHGHAPEAAAAIAAFCPGHAQPDELSSWWFHGRTLAAAHALAGRLSRDRAFRLFACTSTLAMRDAAEPEREARLATARSLVTELEST